MKKTKTQKGITLIALIITIVVLLIIAVVSIGAVKNSGIIMHAQNASKKYTIEQQKELIQLAVSNEYISASIQSRTISESGLITSLDEHVGSDNYSLQAESNGMFVLATDSVLAKVESNGNLTFVESQEIVNSEEVDTLIKSKLGEDFTSTKDAEGNINITNTSSGNEILVSSNGNIELKGSTETWKFAWVSRNGVWDTTSITNETELPKVGENIIIANFYETNRKVEPYFYVSNTTLPEDNAYTLKIEGNGEIADLCDCKEEGIILESTPTYAWFNGVFNGTDPSIAYVDKVIISEGITSIGEAAFHYAISLKDITIPSSVTSIGAIAFFGCTSFETLSIPDHVTSIGQSAFNFVPHVSYTGSAVDSKADNWGAESFN